MMCDLWRTVCIVSIAMSAQAYAAELTANDPYVRLNPPETPNTGAFMVLKNNGAAAQKLIKAESGAAKSVELHNMIDDNGVMRMRQVSEIEIPAGGQIELKPGSYHIMLIGLAAPLSEGEIVAFKLGFADGTTIDVQAPVKKMSVAAPSNMPAQMQH